MLPKLAWGADIGSVQMRGSSRWHRQVPGSQRDGRMLKKKSIRTPCLFQGYTGKSWKSASFLIPGTALCYQIAPAAQECEEFTFQVPEDGTPECTALCLALPAQ